MLTVREQAKITDFGLAKSPKREQLTRTGTTIGTVAYMSPEQGRGEPVDRRSDLWSLGVALYEMITGRRPFKGEHEQAVMYSVLNEGAGSLTGVRSGVPIELEQVVNKCLAKNPDERYQTAADVIADLHRLRNLRIPGARHGDARPPANGNIRRWLWVAAAAVVVIVAIATWPRLFPTTELGQSLERKMLIVLPFENLGAPEYHRFLCRSGLDGSGLQGCHHCRDGVADS